MSSEILKSHNEIHAARDILKRTGLSCITPWPLSILKKFGILNGINVGDRIKSWDVLKTIEYIRTNLPSSSRILDIGAYASEILCILNRLRYSSLTGIDLNPMIKKMPHSDVIRYEVSDFMASPFGGESFEALSAISVIEHGFDGQRLLKEISRLLCPGGHFFASFDYWPEKVDTTGIHVFDMKWDIFSKDEILDFVEKAKTYGLHPVGELRLDAEDKVIRWGGKEYTFAWLALRKTA